MKQEITFDRFVRGLIVIALLAIGYLLINTLSGVLLPFCVAWAIAYMLQPVVVFLQNKCHIRHKGTAVSIVVILFLGCLTLVGWFYIPALVRESMHLKDVALGYIQNGAENATIPKVVQDFIRQHATDLQLDNLLQQDNVQEGIKRILPKAWEILTSTAGTVISLLGSLIAIVYLFLLLLDWERFANGWIDYIPRKRRPFMKKLMGDVEENMAGYFRGQALIALSNCILFSVGFLIIGFPMPIFLGVFIGLCSFVPYLQLVGLAPAAILALLKAAETGENFWLLIGGVLLVYGAVQVLQDLVITPKVMGHIMGLRPVVIFLSLSIFGYLLGIVGLIIALPVTTLIESYYKEYVIGESPFDPKETNTEDTKE